MMAGPAQVTFEHVVRDGEATLIIKGEIDMAVESTFSAEVRALIDRAHSPAVIDCSELAYLDSSGIRVLMDARHHARERSVQLMLVAPSPFVRRVLDITGVSEEFVIRE